MIEKDEIYACDKVLEVWEKEPKMERHIMGIDWGYPTKPTEKKKRFVLVDSLNKKCVVRRVKAINWYCKELGKKNAFDKILEKEYPQNTSLIREKCQAR